MTDNNTYKGALEVLRKRVEDIRDELEEVLREINEVLEEDCGFSAENENMHTARPYYYQFTNADDLYTPLTLDEYSDDRALMDYLKKINKRDKSE